MQARILYPAMLSFKIEGEIKSFPDKQKLKEFVTTKPALQETLRGLLKIRGWGTIYHANGQQKKARVAILISDNLDFKIKTVSRDAEGRYIIINGSIHQEDLIIVNIYAPNVAAPKYINQLLTNIKKLVNSNTIRVGDFNTHLQQWTDHLIRKSTRKQWL